MRERSAMKKSAEAGSVSRAVRFAVLGSVRVQSGERVVHIRSLRQRTMLAALLFSQGATVSSEELISAVWGDTAPKTARNQVHVCIHDIRLMLNKLGIGDCLDTTERGYRLTVDPESVDFCAFLARSKEAAALAQDGRTAEAAALMRAAIGLWRGPVGADLETTAFLDVAVRLNQELLSAWEAYGQWALTLGRHGEVVIGLAEQVERYPLHEPLRALLVRALCRSGRAAEALEVCRLGRQILFDELGIGPGEELRALETRISTVCSAPLAVAGAGPSTLAKASAAVPRQLPRDIADFVGRRSSVSEIKTLVEKGEAGDGPSPLVLLVGAASAGKSAIAVHAAHDLAKKGFPDGQLYADLRSSTADPADPADVLCSFLQALGVASTAVPDGMDEREGLFRTLVADRRLLVLLEDAADEFQVQPLIPGGMRCGVVITSRSRLLWLPGARRVRIGPMTEDEGLDFFVSVLGRRRVYGEIDAARRLVQLVEGRVLGLRIVTARLAAKPHEALATLLERLRDPSRRHTELDFAGMKISEPIAASYFALPHAAQHLLRSLCRASRREFDLHVIAAAADVEQPAVDDMVEHLMGSHLLEKVPAGVSRVPSYRVPELVRILIPGIGAARGSVSHLARLPLASADSLTSLAVRA